MKKYLMTAMAAVAMGATFTSCSHNTDLYGGGENGETNGRTAEEQAELVKAVYNAAFEQAFGKVAPTVDWGFGSGTRAFTRATNVKFDYYDFPDDADASKFLAEVPAGVEKLTQNVGRANNWIDETWTGDLNIWGAATAEGNWQDRSGGTLYIKGNCDFSNRSFYFDGNSELYLLEGATLTLNANNAANLQENTKIYMAANSKIVTPAELKLNKGLHIYNHGTIEANKLSTNNNSVLINKGTVKVTTKISVENELSVIVNDGTLTAADLNTAGSGKFENNVNATISGTTFVNSNNNTWVNNGQYHTGNFIYNAASDQVINNCRLTIDEDFNINLGDNPGTGNFKMNSNSGVVTKNFNGGGNWAKNYSTGWSSFNGGPFYVYMGSNSVFKVTGTATMNATKADYGFYGIGDSFAVLDANKIEAGAANQGYEVTYGGNLYVYAENGHFAQGYSGTYPYIDIKDNAKIYSSGFEDGKPAVKIKETECNPGFEGDGDEPETYTYRVIAEDLNATEKSDFDFNDVVFDVEPNEAGDAAKIVVRAAGGIYKLTVAGQEVHAAFGEKAKADGLYPMINTQPWNPDVKATLIESYSGDFKSDAAIRNTIKNIEIKVYKPGFEENGIELPAQTGKPACKILVDQTFNVVKERTGIADENTNFHKYVQGTWDTEENGFWWKKN